MTKFAASTGVPVSRTREDGKTADRWLRPQIDEAYRIGSMPALLPMLPAPKAGS